MINIDPSHPWFPGQRWDIICQVWAVFSFSHPPRPALLAMIQINVHSSGVPVFALTFLFCLIDRLGQKRTYQDSYVNPCCPDTATSVGIGVRFGLCCIKPVIRLLQICRVAVSLRWCLDNMNLMQECNSVTTLVPTFVFS